MNMNSLDVWYVVAGGAIGASVVMVVEWLRRIASKLMAEWFPIATYLCAERNGLPGMLKHSWGEAIDDPSATKGHGRAWQHTSNHIGDPGGNCTIYGPYTNDFEKPGYYTVRFRVYGSGFGKGDEPVVLIEATQTLVAYDSTQKITVNWYQMPIGQKIIRSGELEPKYKDFDVNIYASGANQYEYRVFVYPEYGDTQRFTIKFDVIQVYRFVPAFELI